MFRRIGVIILSVGTIGILVIVVLYFFGMKSKIGIVDHLCNFVRDEQKMDCVAVLAADTFMKPGAIVDYQGTLEKPDRVPIPISDLFGPGCLVPGTDDATISRDLSAPQAISIPQFTYNANRNLKVGADVEIPQAQGAAIKAGPKWSEVSKIELSADDAWVVRIDEMLAVKVVGSCQIQQRCVDRILAEKYRVVGSAIVASGLNYRLYDQTGSFLDLNNAIRSDVFKANIGVGSDLTTSTDATLKAPSPRVIGVRLMPVSIFSGQQICAKDVLLAVDGSSTVSVAGGGGRGRIAAPPPVSAPLGQKAQLLKMGSEQSECEVDFEQNISRAAAEAQVDRVSDASLKFRYNISASGGHYVTVPGTFGCIGGRVVGRTGHDNTAIASASLTGTAFVTVRSNAALTLRVEYRALPKGTLLQVLDWHNQPVSAVKGELLAPAVQDTGNREYQIQGPGLYRVETRLQLNVSVDGGASASKEDIADMVVSVN